MYIIEYKRNDAIQFVKSLNLFMIKWLKALILRL